MKNKIKNKDIKKEKIKSLAQKIADSKSIIFTDYHGLSANQIAQLRNKIKEAGGELLVIKNTLLTKALLNSGFRIQTSDLAGPTATLLSYEDEVTPLKEIAKVATIHNLPKFKFGFLGKDLLDTLSVDNLSKIPNRDELETKVVGALVSPIYGVVSVLSANIRNLVSVLNQASKQSQSG